LWSDDPTFSAAAGSVRRKYWLCYETDRISY
jgi:hypothetical protein